MKTGRSWFQNSINTFEDNETNPSFQYKSVIIKGSNEKSNISDMLQLFDRNQIRYSYAGNVGKKFKGFDYTSNKDGEVTIDKGDILISAYQPQSRFIQVLFEPDSKTTDSLSYDLTAWALPYVYNLKAYALTTKISADTGNVTMPGIINIPGDKNTYAYVANFYGFDELKFIAALYNKNIKLRYSLRPFTLNGNSFNRGRIIITRGDNKLLENKFDKVVTDAANECHVKLVTTTTGLVDSGKDFGSGYSPLMKKKSVAILFSEESSSGSVGELWYFFERELNYPVTLINTSVTERFDLTDYETLILTSGSYNKVKDTIIDYVKRGGKVISLENSISLFSNRKSTDLAKSIETKTAEEKLSEKKVKSDDSTLLKTFEYETDRRYSLSSRSAGSVYKVKLDDTHPYAFGLGKEWFIMKRTPGFPFLTKGYNIGYILDKEPVAGFAGFKYKDKIKNTIVIGSERIGSGEVVYITDNPYFRAFWKSGRVLLGNVILR